jgi:hypothetical protein
VTRAKIELGGALVAALGLVIALAWYSGERSTISEVPAPVAGTVVRAPEPVPEVPAAELASTQDASAEAVAQLPAEVLARDRAFINEAFPVLSSWSVAEVKPLLSNSALRGSTDAELTQVMTTLNARLGTLQYFDSPQPASAPEAIEYAGTTASLQPYTFTAYYEAGEAEVSLVLEQQQQESSLYSFDIVIPN